MSLSYQSGVTFLPRMTVTATPPCGVLSRAASVRKNGSRYHGLRVGVACNQSRSFLALQGQTVSSASSTDTPSAASTRLPDTTTSVPVTTEVTVTVARTLARPVSVVVVVRFCGDGFCFCPGLHLLSLSVIAWANRW